jgi:hypothetical protein
MSSALTSTALSCATHQMFIWSKALLQTVLWRNKVTFFSQMNFALSFTIFNVIQRKLTRRARTVIAMILFLTCFYIYRHVLEHVQNRTDSIYVWKYIDNVSKLHVWIKTLSPCNEVLSRMSHLLWDLQYNYSYFNTVHTVHHVLLYLFYLPKVVQDSW